MAGAERAASRQLHPARGRVFDYEPQLLEGLDSVSAEAARRAGVADLIRITPGPWSGPDEAGAEDAMLGLLVVDGLLVREARIGAAEATDIAGTGDLIRVRGRCDDFADRAFQGRWRALTPVTLALLDRRFGAVIGRWPEIVANLIERALRRSQQTGVLLALCGLHRLDSRILLLFTYLADRWGRVTRAGVTVELNLTHAVIAQLVSARRPSVSRTLRLLQARGSLVRVPGGWVLPSRGGWPRAQVDSCDEGDPGLPPLLRENLSVQHPAPSRTAATIKAPAAVAAPKLHSRAETSRARPAT